MVGLIKQPYLFRLRNMFPKLTSLNSVDASDRNAKASGDVLQYAPAFKQVANDRNIVVDQLGVLLSHSANMTACFKAVLGVLFRGAPFKIFKTVVSSVVVKMINVVLFWRRWLTKKGQCDETVNGFRRGSAITGESGLRIPVAISRLAKDTGFSSTIRAALSSHSPQIRDRVHAFVPDNGQPNFVIKFFGGKVGISHLQKITPFVNRSGLKDYLRNLSACFYFTTPLMGGVR